MLVRSITLKNFMSHAQTVLALPDKGITVLMGENGQGKSTVIEAVSVAFWNQTLRGPAPWQTGTAGLVSVVTDDDTVIRTVTDKGKPGELKWVHQDREIKADTKSELNKQLEASVGDWDRWRKTHVFSSSDAAHFSDATDKERKVLVENILGMDAFDRGLAKCKTDLAAQQTELGLKRQYAASAAAKYEIVKHALDTWQDVPPFEEEPAPEKPCEPIDLRILAELETQQAELEAAKSQTLACMSLAVLDMEIVVATKQARLALDRARDEQARIAKGNCHACNRPFPKRDADKAVEAVLSAQTALQAAEARESAARAELTANRAKAQHEIASLDDELKKVRADLGRVDSAIALYSRWNANMTTWENRQTQRRQRYKLDQEAREAKRREAEQNLETFQAQLEAEQEAIEVIETEIKLLQTVEKVLGMRGVRVQVLSHALAGIEQVANGWLGRMAPGVELELRPYTQTKTAGINDELSLIVKGADAHSFGGGLGYKASSGGERRRIDIALILGLAEVNAAAEGKAVDGTLWMDEVFDAVSAAHTGAVAECLNELGKSRAIVVITHRADLAEALDAVQRFEVVGGQLHAVN